MFKCLLLLSPSPKPCSHHRVPEGHRDEKETWLTQKTLLATGALLTYGSVYVVVVLPSQLTLKINKENSETHNNEFETAHHPE